MTDDTVKKGRPPGKSTKSKSERLFDRLMNSRGDNLTRIVDKVMELAEAGDTGMIKAVLDRTMPARGRTIKLNLGDDPAKAVARVISAMDAGDITPSEAKDILDVLKARSEMVEAADVQRRIEALENGV